MYDRLEFALTEGRCRGLQIAFEDKVASLALDLSDSYHVKQVHGKEIVELSAAHRSGIESIATADGLIAYAPDLAKSRKKLLIKTADCMPLVMVDQKTAKICIIHAGWRGLVLGIHRVPFEKKWLDPTSTRVWCGPCLNGENFEVGADMWSQFPKSIFENKSVFSAHTDGAKRYFHSWRYLALEMKSLGIECLNNVELDTSTALNFASHRRSVKTGEKQLSNYSWVGFG